MGTVAQAHILGVDVLGHAAMKETCATCMWWSQSDEGGDEEAACVEKMNDPFERKWMTKRNFWCDWYQRIYQAAGTPQ